MQRRLLPDFIPVKTEECGVVMTFWAFRKMPETDHINVWWGKVKGSYVAELKINQGHTILYIVIKTNKLLQNFDQQRSWVPGQLFNSN